VGLACLMQESQALVRNEKKPRGAKKNVKIQKKSLINSLNTTKKALVATTPEKGSAVTGAVKPVRVKAASMGLRPSKVKLAVIS
jgi:hypothetical protein